jgi:hypothetical protein
MHRRRVVHRRLTFAAVVAAVAAAACGGSTAVTEISGPDVARCQTSVSPTPGTLPAAGTRLTLTVVSARECTWNLTSEASWAQVTPASGQGEASVTLTVAENPEARQRSGVLVVNDNRLNLIQEAAPCRFTVSPAIIRLSHVGGRTSVNVSATAGCSWRASSNQSWARVVTDSGTASGSVSIEVSSNTGAARVAIVSVADRPVTIEQEGANPAPQPPGPGPNPTTPPPPPGASPNPPPTPTPTPDPPACTFTLDSHERSFSAAGGTGSFRVITAPGCRWTASVSAGWVDLAGSSSVGPDTVRYTVSANQSANARTAAIGVAGQAHTVRQEAGAPDPPPNNGNGDGEKVSLSGRVFLVEGSCPSLEFFLNFRRVFTDGDTNFKGGCGDIRNGTEVTVDGRMQRDGRVRATKVDIGN